MKHSNILVYSKTCLKLPLKNRQNNDLNDKWLPNEGQKYCRMLPLENSAILLTCIKQLLVLKTNSWGFFSYRFRQVLLYCCNWNIFYYRDGCMAQNFIILCSLYQKQEQGMLKPCIVLGMLFSIKQTTGVH